LGAIYEARCTCGYDTGELAQGCGIRRICWNLATCASCRRLVSVLAGEALRCPQCEGAVTVLDLHASDEVSSQAPEATYSCPVCGKQTLRLVLTALWD
jgi:hypothetical protein